MAPANRVSVPDRRRLVRAWSASAVAGLLIYALVLPRLAAGLTDVQISWLRTQFHTHPIIVLASLLAAVAIVASPVLVVFRLVYGRFRARYSVRGC